MDKREAPSTRAARTGRGIGILRRKGDGCSMTADAIFNSVIALMFSEESDKNDYRDKFLAQLNMKLEETFQLNNSLRVYKGKEDLPEPPWITDLTEEVGYEFEVERSLLPLGIAGDLYVDDDETGISNDYRERYQAGILSKARAEWTECGVE